MTRTNWANDPAVRKIDIRKLSVLMALINQSEGKSFNEMIPAIIEANKNLTSMGLAFTNDEIRLIFDVLKTGMSDAELQQFNKLRTLMNLPNWT
ncbi:MAG: hypothetical protein ACI4BB_01510 [Coprococcus sp.]